MIVQFIDSLSYCFESQLRYTNALDDGKELPYII